MNYFSKDLYKQIQPMAECGIVTISYNENEIFSKLSSIYPMIGSSIDWEKLAKSVSKYSSNLNSQKTVFQDFFFSNTKDFSKNVNITYVCDGGVDFCITANIGTFNILNESIFDIPQHHYFIALDFSWCMSFRMTGEMDFGRISHNN